MGNSLGVSIDGSLIVGVPYAWIKWPNNIWRDSYKSNTERKIGTIAKFNLITDKIEVPKAVPQDRNGAHWGFGINRQKATWEDPRRHDMTGVSFVKGVNVLNIFIISRCKIPLQNIVEVILTCLLFRKVFTNNLWRS